MVEQQKQINIKAEDDIVKGRYTNNMQVSHTKEEFVVDFFNIFPPAGMLVSRVITSPSQYKRMVKAMQTNLELYEKNHGKVEEVKESDERKIGFKTD